MIYYNGVIFSQNECIQILESAKDFKESGLNIYVSNTKKEWVTDYKKRKASQSELISTRGSLVYDRISDILNKIGYEFIVDEFIFDIIKYKIGDFVYKHKDGGDHSNRVLSLVIQLNESTDYSGGILKYWNTETECELSKEIGEGIIFGANIYHEVTEITSGERNSLVLFINSNQIKKKGISSLF